MTGYPKAVAAGWFPVAAARQVGARPLARSLMDRPLVMFRSGDEIAVFADRCPHRNAPLSRGRVVGGQIECPYHGWRFGPGGRCTATPGSGEAARHEAEPMRSEVRDGLVWTTLAHDPAPLPPLPHPIGREGFDSFWWPVRASRAGLIDAVENLLDPAHPHFVHSGIVRSGGARRPVAVTVRTGPDFAEAAYTENARPTALVPRLLEGFRIRSLGRFFPPATGQIVFEGETGLRLAITVFFTPESASVVRPFAHFATPKGRAPAWLKEGVLRLAHMPILAQDRAILSLQQDNVEAFGARRYAAGPLDFLRPSIQALANGETPAPTETARQILL